MSKMFSLCNEALKFCLILIISNKVVVKKNYFHENKYIVFMCYWLIGLPYFFYCLPVFWSIWKTIWAIKTRSGQWWSWSFKNPRGRSWELHKVFMILSLLFCICYSSFSHYSNGLFVLPFLFWGMLVVFCHFGRMGVP